MNNRNLMYGILAVVLLVVTGAGVYAFLDSRKGDPVSNSTKEQNSTNTDTQTKPDEIATIDEDKISATNHKSEKGVELVVTTPARASKVSSPLTVTGTVPGNWSSEGQFTVRLLDADGNVLAEGPAKLSGDWMTEDQVPFTATLTFTAPSPDTAGLLVLEKANPSDLPENVDSASVFVQF